MSGGVDSSVAAYLLKEQGYEVTGITLTMWSEALHKGHPVNCSMENSEKDAKAVAQKLGIDHITVNCEAEFQKHVVDNFADVYTQGKTPNPCIQCNKYIKFGFMLEYAEKNGYDYIATGHYAKIEQNSDGIYELHKSDYDAKDQTYVLYNLTQNQLSRILMPLGNYTKEQIRKIAEEKIGMFISEKKDSMEICFIPDDNHTEFIEYYAGYTPIPGDFTDTDGNILGQHKGIINYTVGQRKGLGIAFGKPMFVTRIEPDTNRIILGEEGSQYSKGLIAEDISFTNGEIPPDGTKLMCKTRYSAKPAECTIISTDNNTVKVSFDQPLRAVTPGQSVVFYRDDITLGGGIIKSTF
jgi:tRNA-specific 2-thiouridylase